MNYNYIRLKDYVDSISINEMARPKGSKNKPKEPIPAEDIDVDTDIPQKAVMNGKLEPISKVDDVKKGEKPAKKQTWAVEPPPESMADGKAWTLIDKSHMTKNQRALASRMKSGRNFMAIGEAGWGKTAEITAMAHKFGLTVLTVYLDKAVATDLDGIPVPAVDEETGEHIQARCMPGWAIYMLQHPKEQFLLFFDEMNQAPGDVQNALMPIALKKVICGTQFNNFICGAAGNHDYENDEVSELSAPLKARLMPFIWECNTEETWNSHFEWAHSKYDEIIGEKTINEVAKLWKYWKSPRDLEICIYKYLKENIDGTFDTPESIFDDLFDNAVNEKSLSSTECKKQIGKFAEYMYNWCEDPSTREIGKGSISRKKGMDNIDKDVKKMIVDSLVNGYFYWSQILGGDNKTYCVTLENCLTERFDPVETGITAEVLKKIVRDLEATGKSVKYRTQEEAKEDCKKNGWVLDYSKGYLPVDYSAAGKEEPKRRRRYNND